MFFQGIYEIMDWSNTIIMAQINFRLVKSKNLAQQVIKSFEFIFCWLND